MGILAPTHSQVCPMTMMEWYGALVLLLLISKLRYNDNAICIGFAGKASKQALEAVHLFR